MSYWLEERTELREQDLKILSCTFILADEWRILMDHGWKGWGPALYLYLLQ